MATAVELPSGIRRLSQEIVRRYVAGEFSIDDVLRIVDESRPTPPELTEPVAKGERVRWQKSPVRLETLL